ncbi:MAG: hypothetical protein V3S10_01905, partial [Dehalococcoidales bacterium]
MMKKKWSLIVAPLVALAVLFSALPTLAQEHTGDAEVVPPPALGIRAPRSVLPDEEMTLVVFDRASEDPIADAGVWAIPFDDPVALRTDITALEGATDDDWLSFLDSHGRPLGTTDEDGRLTATFTAEGRYLLVAFKSGYLPGFKPLLAGLPPPALAIRAPRSVLPDQEMTLVVFDRASEAPVADAGVWAIPLDDPEALRTEITALEGATDDDWQSFLDDHGRPLGTTNEDGRLGATFTTEGRYLLVAFKSGYRPGFKRLLVEAPPKALGIDVAHKVVVGEEVTITVFDRASKEPVEGAGVWAIPRANSGRLRSGLARLREHGDAVATVAEFEALLGDAAYLGLTDRAGQ